MAGPVLSRGAHRRARAPCVRAHRRGGPARLRPRCARVSAMPVDERTPVLVGVGMVEQREEDPADAVETLELMLRAVRAAGDDAGRRGAALLARAGLVAIPKGQWHYGDPGRLIA